MRRYDLLFLFLIYPLSKLFYSLSAKRFLACPGNLEGCDRPDSPGQMTVFIIRRASNHRVTSECNVARTRAAVIQVAITETFLEAAIFLSSFLLLFSFSQIRRKLFCNREKKIGFIRQILSSSKLF